MRGGSDDDSKSYDWSLEEHMRIDLKDNGNLHEIQNDIKSLSQNEDGTAKQMPLFNVPMGRYMFAHSLYSSEAEYRKHKSCKINLYSRHNWTYII